MRLYLFLCLSFAAFLVWAKPLRPPPLHAAPQADLTVALRVPDSAWVQVRDENGRSLTRAMCSVRELETDDTQCVCECEIETLEGWFEIDREPGMETTLRFEGRSSVTLCEPDAGRYRAVAVPLEAIRRSIRLPSGAVARNATVRASADAWRDGAEPNPILVHAYVWERRPVRFEFSWRDFAQLPERFLQPLVRSRAK